VQAAVNDAQTYESTHASDPTIALCGGTFTEQVYVAYSLKFANVVGMPASTIELPAAVGLDQTQGLSNTACQSGDSGAVVTAPQSVMEICQTGAHATVSISGITIEGQWPGNVCYDSLYGILVGGGATLDLANSTVKDIGGSALTDGCQGGVAVQVGFSPTGQVGRAVLTHDTVNSYQKNGITIDGTGSGATITGGSVTGGGPTSQIGQNGIQVSFGATAAISGETITANQCGISPPTCGPDP